MSNRPSGALTWVEINKSNLIHNIKTFRRLSGQQVILAPCVKANAYGHGLIETSKIISGAGTDWLCVNALFEASALRAAGIKIPIYILGYVMIKELKEAVRLGCRLVVYNKESVVGLAKAARKLRCKARIHVKIETGNNRQGILMDEVLDFAKFVRRFPEIELEGVSTHFANIEDTLDPSYAMLQLCNFEKAIRTLAATGFDVPIKHCANSAATMLHPETHFNMVRPGIAVYGLWPSEEVRNKVEKLDCASKPTYKSTDDSVGDSTNKRDITLKPVLSWKTRVAQIKEVQKGSYIGYGCTFRAPRRTKLAILPVGYYDGYDRGFSNKSHVLLRGARAPLRGRVCMNIIMTDVTDIPNVSLEDTATLIGKDGREEITAEELASLIGTINYEITTRINEKIPRVVTTN